MLLQRLNEYGYRIEREAAEHGAAIPSAYTMQTIPWIIDLNPQGRFIGLVRTADERAQKARGKKFAVPYLRRSGSKVKPQLLADKAEFVLGIPDRDEERAGSRHRDFAVLVRACFQSTSDVLVEAVAKFLDEGDFRQLLKSEKILPGEFMTFRVGSTFPADITSIQKFWNKIAPFLGEKGVDELTPELIQSWANASHADGKQDSNWKCLVCGEACSPARVHPVAIKLPRSVADQQCSVVTANKEAFWSYGLEQSLIAPTCRSCAERYAKAVNRLIEREDTHVTIGPLVYLFWTKDNNPFSVASLLSRPEADEVRTLITSIFRGQQAATQVDSMPFYATAFSASGGRVVVRDWLDTTVERARRNLARYFAFQQITERDGTAGRPHGLFALAAATVRDANRELVPSVPQSLLHMALKGGSLPKWLLFQTVRRNRAEAGQWNDPKRYPYGSSRLRQRIALIKLVLLSQQETLFKEETMVQLDPNNGDPAYLCGRLLAVLESVQQAAIPGVNTTITDRFFGTASSAPASVFGHLIRSAMVHLGKLRKEKPRTYEAFRRRLAEVQEPLRTFPKTLTLEQQGLFGLGYFHQQAADRATAIAYRQSRENEKKETDNQ
jgi:CRISPR-associated protein Csd1